MIKPGAVVIDVGINRVDGPCRPSRATGSSATCTSRTARRSRRAITPVPGGVGPMTIAMLLDNTVQAARQWATL